MAAPENDQAHFRLGINYWPAQTGMRWWQRFDPEVVDADFRRIRDAGMDTVRFFLHWEDFQPVANEIDARMLEHLRLVADIASAAQISLMPTLFTGHMSGVNFIPAWALGPEQVEDRFRVVASNTLSHQHIRNWYTDAEVTDSQELLAGEAARCLAGHPALWAWDLGNENSNCVIPPSEQAASEWLGRMCAAIRKADPQRPITIGLHMEDLEEDRGMRPSTVAKHCDFLCMHGYPQYCTWARGDTDEMLLPFLTAITRWLGDGTDVLFAEFGAATYQSSDSKADEYRDQSLCALLEEQDAASYTQRALKALHRCGSTGAMLWCYADYETKIWHETPFDESVHERFFGLWRPGAQAKPVVTVLREFEGKSRLAAQSSPWIDIDPEQFYAQPRAQLARLYAKFLEVQ